MIRGTLIEHAAQPVATWRGGTTRAVYAHPVERLADLAAAHIWVGTATIERGGAYSVFPNRTRIHLPIRGHGLHLHFQQPDEAVTLLNFEQAIFAGDRPLEVTLVDGAVEAFNLIFHPTVQATLQVLNLTADSSSATLPPMIAETDAAARVLQVVYVVNGSCTVSCAGAQAAVAQAGDAFVGELAHEIGAVVVNGIGDFVVATLVWSSLV